MRKITIAKGDGIGPEIMDATLRILKAAEVPVIFDEVEIGEKVYLSGNTTGIPTDAWNKIRENKIFLKAPITTPRGGGYKSLNVTLRKTLGLFANVRPSKSLAPYVSTKHPDMDVVIIRENEEDLYAGIEHRQTDEVVQCLKLITRPGSEKIVRYAFEYAKLYKRKKVSCFVKDNIMKLTDGLFLKVFKEIAAEYPEIESDNWIVDIGTAKLANEPELFDVVVMPNLYGDVVSDITAEISGSVGLAGSSNIGSECAMFEAIHGSAPLIAGQNIANPSGLLRGAIMMLNHIGEQEAAIKIQNAWSCTIEEGIHTADIYREGKSSRLVNTTEFSDAVIERLGKSPQKMEVAEFDANSQITIKPYKRPAPAKKELQGVDVFVHSSSQSADELGSQLQRSNGVLSIQMITNRGVKVWPQGFEETFCTDHWRCRFTTDDENVDLNNQLIINLLQRLLEDGVDVIKTENLYNFDGERGYSLGQGQ
jgi:isocitrate dehydrogenase